MKLEGLDLIKEVRANPDRYLPMVDHTEEVPHRNEYGDVNIGWNAGLLESNRPYFVECWAADGITMLTIFVSTKGIEQKTPDELTRWFLDIGYFSFTDGGYQTAEIGTFTNPEGAEFFSINIAVGVGDNPALIDGAPIYPWKTLNEYNRTEKHAE
jgi:hypothetical protein